MIFPVVYAVLTWALAMYWRRRWPSFLAVAVSVGSLILLIGMVRAWREHIPPQFQVGLVLVYPYTVLVAIIGVFICFLPRRVADLACRECQYDLTGLNPVGLKCPECGEAWRGCGSSDEDAGNEFPLPRESRAVFGPAPAVSQESDDIVIDWPVMAR